MGPPPYVGVLFMASAAHGVFKGVNLIDHVSLDEGYVIGVLWCIGWSWSTRLTCSNALNKA